MPVNQCPLDAAAVYPCAAGTTLGGWSANRNLARNGHRGSNGPRAVEDAERGLYPCLSMFILLLDCLTF